MKLLVTGGSGQLVQSLIARAGDGIKIHRAMRPDFDMAQPETLAAMIDRIAPDALVNAAAYTAVDAAEQAVADAFAVNATAPGVIAQIAAVRSLPLVHISTDYVFNGQTGAPYREDSPTAPPNVYGASKLAGEQAVQAAGDDHLILRTAWVYSPFGKNFLLTMLRLAETRDAIDVVADQVGNPTSALDLADGVFAALAVRLDSGRFPVSLAHFAGTGSTTWCDFARHIMASSAAAGGPDATIRAIDTAAYPTPAARPADSRLDCTLFARIFGHAPPPWQSSATAVVQHYLGGQRAA
ncbi:dTDP-4-dehydrorhamnose reductase [Sphingomonas sp. PB4P5]|uniref:dTDP-4-dehydrorhamnose reductase n=1 Tax=Parasphingomonas puruogangriensis TaxID=3096155 RepID=UPI002FC88ECA